MAKKSMIERERKREELVSKYEKKRLELKSKLKKTAEYEEKLEVYKKIQEIPRNAFPSRLRNRCWVTGRSRGYYRDFGLSRHVLREMVHDCLLPGVTKSSW
ncbi:ribosomal protein S14 (chloroplast) [Guillardia theta]|uniref:Small ribosomal subunit protein uS14c n=2 Tax=Guillardia theta TaxID=55529 RepID=RR14_GUITH|nr:ribosomal protein S14 [Guillardia theta]O78506.1 RecName: Full=Small ribosomal subunit protein uS14c; AltName: Full=30S ribosomal protein S14, chloroplastic [Guillardia theta]AAC35697.1 ribosomal protein S14 [Guillardia theta]